MSGNVLWLLVVLPATLGAGLCLSGRRTDGAAGPIAVATAAGVTGLAVAAALSHPAVAMPFVAGDRFGLAVDTMSAIVIVTVTVVGSLVIAFAAAERGGDVPAAPSRFFGLMLLFLAAVLITATATTLPALLLGWEVMGAASYALIGFRWPSPERVEAGLTAFLTTRTADLGLYLAAGAAAAGSGLAGGSALDLSALPDLSSPWRDVVTAGVLVAGLGKAAQLPFSFWLSRAMLGPSPVSALLHSAAMVAMGGYLLLRVAPLLAATGWGAAAAAWVGALTALVLGAVAVAQRDLKQLLAASTAAQLGFVVLAAGMSATAGGTAHLVAHASTKALLFLAAGAWLTALGTKQVDDLRGAARRWPVVGVCATVGLLALAGVAPLSLWATKDAILAATWPTAPLVATVALAAAAVSAAYAGKVLAVLWVRPAASVESRYDAEEIGTRRVPRTAQAVLLPLAVGAAVLGWLALPPVAGALAAAVGAPAEPEATAGELIGSAVLALIVLAAVMRRGAPSPAWAVRWLALGSAVTRVMVHPTLRLATSLARFDDGVVDRGVSRAAGLGLRAGRAMARTDDMVVDGAVRDVARGTTRAAARAGRFDVRGVDAAVEALARGVRGWARLARRPQTGRLHQYYLQVVVLLAVGALVLVVVS